jgi:hypothetical protein
MDLIDIALISPVILAVLGFALMEWHRRTTRTRILQIPGGLLFEAQHFSVQVQRKEKMVHVRSARGRLTLPSDRAAPAVEKTGRVEHSFPALGFSVEWRDKAKQKAGSSPTRRQGPTDIVFRGADDTRLTVGQVNSTVANSFEYFFLQVQRWIDKLEQRAERERVERLRSEEEAAQAQQDAELMARLLASKPPNEALSQDDRDGIAAAQIAQWRRAAGFEGLHTLHKTDANGRVEWLVDLAADGRITLHAGKRTIHTSLLGATITSGSGELEVGVRDAYWSEHTPELRVFGILKGCSSEERRAWKERLEIIRNSLTQDAGN